MEKAFEEKDFFPLLEQSFPGIVANISRCTSLGFPWSSSQLFLQEEQGKIVSHVGCLDYPIWIDGKLHRAAALHAVCTEAAFRNKGRASALIQKALDWAQGHYEFVLLFTGIPAFYEKSSFQKIQEHRFHLPCKHPQGTLPLFPLVFPKDNELFLRCFKNRTRLSERVWVKDEGYIASFNALFGGGGSYWPLHYSPSIDGLLGFEVQDKTLHLFDVVAQHLPSLEHILDHLPCSIEEIYFYFPPDRFTQTAKALPYLYDDGHLLVHGGFPSHSPFMISPLSRC